MSRTLALLLATSCAGDVLAFSLPTHVLRRGTAATLRVAADNTHYEAIGVGKQASASEVRTAYLKLAKRLHPDVSKDPADTARFKKITEAYDVLSDSRLRSEYDQVVCLELTRQRLPRRVKTHAFGLSDLLLVSQDLLACCMPQPHASRPPCWRNLFLSRAGTNCGRRCQLAFGLSPVSQWDRDDRCITRCITSYSSHAVRPRDAA